MSARSTAALLLLAVAAFAVGTYVAGAPAPARRTVYAKQFPAGEGQELVAGKCQTCHSAMLITQQHKDSTAWEKTTTLMEKWSAPMTPDDHATVIRYLLRSFGPATKK